VALDKRQGLEQVFDIAMAPVLALNSGDGCNIYDTKVRLNTGQRGPSSGIGL
jgi:hypothetical protein